MMTLLIWVTALLLPVWSKDTTQAVELPPAGSVFYLQTSSPNRALGIGDWYTNSTAGDGYHYITLHVPCGWPSGTPIYVDLFHPDLNNTSGAGVADEITTAGSTVFEIYQPGTSLNPATNPTAPGPGAPGSLQQTIYTSGSVGPQWNRFYTIDVGNTGCGTYILRAQTNGNADNSWRLRFGADNDNNPATDPLPNYDNPDGQPGTGDELSIGMAYTTYQHSGAGAQCLTLFEYVAPGQPTVTFHNFDMDGNVRVRYYAPSATFDASGLTGGSAGTVSGATRWNGSTNATRAGDVVNNPEPGWWRIVSCVNNNNQFIQEGQSSVPVYLEPPPAPGLTLSKTDGVDFAAPGEVLTYTLTFTNTGNGITAPGPAYNVVLIDTLPADVIFQGCVAPNGTCTHSGDPFGGTVTYTRTDPLNHNASDTITITVQINPSLTSSVTLTNTAVLDYRDGFGNQYPQLQATDTTVVNQPLLQLSKTDGSTVTAPGQALTYTLIFTNTGLAPAYNITLSDTLPPEVTFQSCSVGSLGGTCNASGSTVTFNLATPLAAGASASVSITVQVNATVTGPTTLTNTATLDYTDVNGNVRPSVSATDQTQVPAQPNIVLSKTDGSTVTAPGQSLTYTLTFTNTGAGDAYNITLSDNLPAGVTYQSCNLGSLSGTCSESGGVVTFTLTNPLAAGASASVSITVQVNTTVTGPTTLTNTATLDYTDVNGNVRPSVSATDQTQVPAQPNIVLSKTDGSTVTAPNQTLTYTLTFTNTGAGDAYNITLSDNLPASVTYQSCNLGSLSGTCSESGGVVTFTLTNPLAAGASASVSITVQVNTTVTGPTTLTNTATLDYTDVNGNVRPSVSATDQTQVPAQPNIVLSKTDGSTVTAPNQTLTYTLTFTNTGAGDAYNITLSDNLPASVTYQSCNLGSLSGTCSESGGVVTFTLTNPLAAGDSASVSTTVQVNATVTGPTTLTNTATLNYTDSANQPRPQVSASDSTQVPAQPTIVLSKTDGSTVTAPGQTLTYTLTFTNTGVGDAYNITLSDTLPAGVSYQSCSPACNVSGSTVTFNLGTLAAGASASVSITVQVDTTVTGPTTLTNTATLNYTDSANQPRPQVSASDSTYVPGPTTVDLIKRASLVVDSNSDNLAGPGDVIEYTLVLTNTGPEIALRLNVSDTPDANTTLVVGSVAATPPTAVIVSGNTTGDAAVEVTLDELAVNAVLTITFRVQVNNPLPDSVTEISNQATATGANISSTPSDDPTTTDPDDPTRLRTPPPGGPPTAIVLTELRLVTSGSGWDIVWTTGAEINTRGFLIYRSTAGRDKAQLLTPIPIPARGSTTNGASYRFSDTTALTGVDYSYWLVEIELDGTVNEYGPLQSRGTISQQHRYFIPLIGR
jgi:uncharacterized repeat protein (TIGR01451 family)